MPELERSEVLSRPRLSLLAAIAALGSLAMQMVIPSLPSILHDFATDRPTVQLIVTVYLVGFGIGQLLAGPVSDALGRKPVLLVGLVLFCVSSALGSLAPTIQWLIFARVLQAMGGAAGLVSARAIIADMSHGQDAAGRLATLTTVVLLSPMIAPTIGGAIAGWGNWRIIFDVLAMAGLVALVLTMLRIPPGGSRSVTPSIAAFARVYGRLARNRRFCRYALANAAASTALYIFLSGSPFLLIRQWGLAPQQAGLCYLVITSAGVLGTTVVGRLERRGGAFRIGLLMMSLGAVAMVMLATAGFSGLAYLVAPMMIVCAGSGIAAPAGIVGAMHAEAGVAGTASSLAGAFQMLVSAGATSAVSVIGSGTFRALAVAIFVASSVGLVLAPGGRAIQEK